MAASVITGPVGLESAVGGELGVSDWHEVTQELIDAFAGATGDDYWIHTDPTRAAGTPTGSTIAHGLLTLSLGPMLMYEIVSFEGFSMGLNYGYDKVRFIDPVPVGSRLRLRASLNGLTATPGGLRAAIQQTFEREGSERPACVADQILHFVE